MKMRFTFIAAIVASVLVIETSAGGKAAKKGSVSKAEMAKAFGTRQGAAVEGTGIEDGDDAVDFFDAIDPATVGRKDCVNEREINSCVDDCETDRDCAATAQESMCEQDCLTMCKYLENWNGRKCVNHMMAFISYYRDFAVSGTKRKVKPISNGGQLQLEGEDGQPAKKVTAKSKGLFGGGKKQNSPDDELGEDSDSAEGDSPPTLEDEDAEREGAPSSAKAAPVLFG